MSLIAPVSAIAGRKFTMKIHSESELHFLVNEVKAGLKKNGNMFKMATTPIFGKILKKSSRHKLLVGFNNDFIRMFFKDPN